MISHVAHVMTLANSIIGVSVLAMPFCFKLCGIVLAVVVLLFCSLLSRLACHFLIKSAVMSRRRNFEFLAFHAFGPMGKFLVELFIIGFLVGTCIAFYVVIGDLGPQIIAKFFQRTPESIRTSFLLTTTALIILPLGLLRNIDSLASISTATIGFYLCLVLKVIVESIDHILQGDWYEKVNYWRPAGILQCLPIFSMALFCQTQLFEIYESIHNVSLEKMNLVVRGALNICTVVYLCVGFFGYVAFCNESFAGNILMILTPSLTSDVIKIGFVLSVIFSFPLVVFPCRASLNSLLFRRVYSHEQVVNYIPEIRFRCLTFTIVTVALIIGIMMPNIEFVLGIVGSTIGVMICLILPAAFFIVISTKNTNERLVAQGILFVGVWIMILGTYTNLYAMEEVSPPKIIIETEKPPTHLKDLSLDDIHLKLNEHIEAIVNNDVQKNLDVADTRREPPIPVELPVITEKPPIIANSLPPPHEDLKDTKIIEPHLAINKESAIKSVETQQENVIINNRQEDAKVIEEKNKQDQQANDILINSEVKKNEDAGVVHSNDKMNSEAERVEHEEVLKKLEEHRAEERKLMDEQKALLQDINKNREELERLKQLNSLESKISVNEEKTEVKNDNIVNNPINNNAVVREHESDMKIISASFNDVRSNNNAVVDNKTISNGKNEAEKVPRDGNIVNNADNNIPPAPVINRSQDSSIIGNPGNLSIGSHDPIVNVLTNWTIQRNSPNSQDIPNIPNKSEEIVVKDIPKDAASPKVETQNVKQSLLLPIPLKLLNQTKDKDLPADDKKDNAVNESSVIVKKIVDDDTRMKREISPEENAEVAINDDKTLSNHPSKIDEPDLKGKSDVNESVTKERANNNNEFKEQQLNNEILLEPNPMNIEYQILKKRDLKALKFV